MDPAVTSDPIIDEIHAARRAMSEKFGGDLKAMLEDANLRQEASGRSIWKAEKRRLSRNLNCPVAKTVLDLDHDF